MIKLALILFALGAPVMAQPTVNRTPKELCAEVAIEVKLSVDSGLLSGREANRIITRCYAIYANGFTPPAGDLWVPPKPSAK